VANAAGIVPRHPALFRFKRHSMQRAEMHRRAAVFVRGVCSFVARFIALFLRRIDREERTHAREEIPDRRKIRVSSFNAGLATSPALSCSRALTEVVSNPTVNPVKARRVSRRDEFDKLIAFSESRAELTEI